jgi:peptidoglycan/LPS O-acetylase OafA/YrhL
MAPSFGVRIPELDGLRGLAILLVLAIHWFGVTNPELTKHPALFWVAYGFSGVDLFFVLSGFLVGGILMDVHESPSYFRTFYFRRICRIFPLYYLFLLLVVAHTYFAAGISTAQANQLPYYAAFLQNFSMAFFLESPLPHTQVTWSLAIEEQFYLTLPLLIRFVSPKRLPQILCGAIVAVPLIRFGIADRYGSTAAYMLTFCRADALLLGVLAAWAWRDQRAWRWLVSRRSLLRTTVIALGVAIFFMRAYLRENIYSYGMIRMGYTLFGLFYVSLLLFTLSDTTRPIANVFRFKPLRLLGTVAYCVYLIHGPVNDAMHHWVLETTPQTTSIIGVAVTLLSALAVALVAFVSWHVFEKPLIAIGHSSSYAKPVAQTPMTTMAPESSRETAGARDEAGK